MSKWRKKPVVIEAFQFYVHSDKFIEAIDKNIEYENERKKKSLNDCKGDCECCEKCSSN